MECYICHKQVKRHEYTRHVGSHLAGNVTGLQPNAAYSSFSPHFNKFDSHSPASDDWVYRFQDDHSYSPAQPNSTSSRQHSFRRWLQDHKHDAPGYTTIDGQKRSTDSEDVFIKDARILRKSSRQRVVEIVKDFKGFSDDQKETCLELVQKTPIFPGLVAHTYTHLVMCPPRGWFLTEDWSHHILTLKQVVDWWTKEGEIQCVLTYDAYKKRLLDFFLQTKIKSQQHRCNPKLLNGSMVLDHDICNLAALVALSITGPKKDEILRVRGRVNTERLVNLFHDLLLAEAKLERWTGWYQRCFFNSLIFFTKVSGYCPPGIYLADDAISLDQTPLGQGGFGQVFKGRIGDRQVALKVLAGNVGLAEYRKDLSKEAIVWRHFHHPNCLPFYGIYCMPTRGPNLSFALVSPLMEQGTLVDYLKDNPNASRTSLILDVVRGLDYLHSLKPHVAHRDIKPDNILITKKGHACLADFGLASVFDTDDHFRTATDQFVICGTVHYMAPELLDARGAEAKKKVNRRRCDMYALGCTIFAAYTGAPPLQEIHRALLVAKITSGERAEFPEGIISNATWSFIESLWAQDPRERPTAQLALVWMEEEARREGIDPSPAPFEEEWEWRGDSDDKCSWFVESKYWQS